MSTSSDATEPTTSASPISRGTFLRGTAAAAGALLAAPASTVAAPYVKRPPEGTITIWDRAGDLYQVFGATIPVFNKKYPRITVKHVAVDVDAKLPTTLTTGINVPDGAFYEDVNLPIQAAHLYDITKWIQPYTKDLVPFKLQVNTQHGRIL